MTMPDSDEFFGKQLSVYPKSKGKTHFLKIDYDFLDALINGKKTFEIRFNDRGYKVGDSLAFGINGNKRVLASFKVLGILHEFKGLEMGYIIMSLSSHSLIFASLDGDSQ